MSASAESLPVLSKDVLADEEEEEEEEDGCFACLVAAPNGRGIGCWKPRGIIIFGGKPGGSPCGGIIIMPIGICIFGGGGPFIIILP